MVMIKWSTYSFRVMLALIKGAGSFKRSWNSIALFGTFARGTSVYPIL